MNLDERQIPFCIKLIVTQLCHKNNEDITAGGFSVHFLQMMRKLKDEITMSLWFRSIAGINNTPPTTKV